MPPADKKSRTRKEWEAGTLAPLVTQRPERAGEFSTVSSLPIERLAAPDDLAGWSTDEKLGFPGEYPYTRGVYPTMYRGRLVDDAPVRGLRHARPTPTRASSTCSSTARRASRPPSTCRR